MDILTGLDWLLALAVGATGASGVLGLILLKMRGTLRLYREADEAMDADKALRAEVLADKGASPSTRDAARFAEQQWEQVAAARDRLLGRS